VGGVLFNGDMDGNFLTYCPISEKGKTTITVVSTDAAGNARTVEESVTYFSETTAEVSEDEAGRTFLMVSILILVLVIVLAVLLIIRGRRRVQATEQEDKSLVVEVEAEGPRAAVPTPSPKAAMAEPPVAKAPEGAAAAKAPAPPGPAPVTAAHRPVARPQARRVPMARPRTVPVRAEEKADKGLSDKGAETDMSPDESEPEVK